MMIYTEPWNRTSSGHIGSGGHLEQDATDFIAWGFDALRFDIPEDYSPGVNFAHAQVTAQMSQYLKAAAGHAVPISSSAWWPQDDLSWAPLVANSFQDTSGLYDLSDLGTGRRVVLWGNFMATLARTTSVPWLSGPGHYHTIDWMPTSYGSVFPTMYALMSSPLWVGDVAPWAHPGVLRIFKNRDFIEVDQDPLGSPATLVAVSGNSQVWLKRLANGNRAVGFLNTSTTATAKIGLTGAQLGFLPNQTVYFKSVWAQIYGKFIGSYSTTVQPMDAAFYLMSGSPLAERR
jgi:alpha-galactosidase